VRPTELIRASEDRLLWQRMVVNVVVDARQLDMTGCWTRGEMARG